MKYTFPTLIFVSLSCITGTVAAKTQQKYTFSKKPTTHHVPAKTSEKEIVHPVATEKPQVEQKLAVVAVAQKAVATRSVQEVINETTDKNNRAKFGIAAMVKAFREQAANNNNPEKYIFAQDLTIGEQLLNLKGHDLKQAKDLAEKLSPKTKKLLQEALEKRYSIFTRLGALKDFVNTRELATA